MVKDEERRYAIGEIDSINERIEKAQSAGIWRFLRGE
jgi:hypothetical protein